MARQLQDLFRTDPCSIRRGDKGPDWGRVLAPPGVCRAHNDAREEVEVEKGEEEGQKPR